MAQYVAELSDKQAEQINAIFVEIKKSKLYRQWQEIDADIDSGAHNLSEKKKLTDKKVKLINTLLKEFKKRVADVPGIIQESNYKPSKNIWQKMLNREPEKNKYLPPFAEDAFYNEMKNAGTFRENFNEGRIGFNEFNHLQPPKVNTLSAEQLAVLRGTSKAENKPEPKVENMENTVVAEATKVVEKTEVNTETAKVENKVPEQPIPAPKTETGHSEQTAAESFNAETIYKEASENKDGNGAYFFDTVAMIATKDATYKPQTILRELSKGLDEEVYLSDSNQEARLASLYQAAEGIKNIAAHNKDNSDVSLVAAQAMHKIAQNVLNYKAEHDVAGYETSFGVCQQHIIEGYGEMTMVSDGLRKQALSNIEKLAKIDNYGEHYPDQIIKSVHSISQGSDGSNNEVLGAAYSALKGLNPQTTETAMQMLSTLQKIGKGGDKNLQSAMVEDVYRIFKKFDKSEEIQRKCLETIKPFGENGVNDAKVRAYSFEKIIVSKTAATKTGREGGYEKPIENKKTATNTFVFDYKKYLGKENGLK